MAISRLFIRPLLGFIVNVLIGYRRVGQDTIERFTGTFGSLLKGDFMLFGKWTNSWTSSRIPVSAWGSEIASSQTNCSFRLPSMKLEISGICAALAAGFGLATVRAHNQAMTFRLWPLEWCKGWLLADCFVRNFDPGVQVSNSLRGFVAYPLSVISYVLG